MDKLATRDAMSTANTARKPIRMWVTVLQIYPLSDMNTLL